LTAYQQITVLFQWSLFFSDNRLSDNVESVKNENLALQVEITRLKQENQELIELAQNGGYRAL
jgi:hypothetical protein